MAQNKLSDLNNHLFAQLERLNDETIKGDKMHLEIEKAKAMSSVAKQITATASIVLKATELQVQGDIRKIEIPKTIL